MASATAAAAAAAATRSPACAGQPTASRHTPAETTARAHTAVIASTQRAAPSVPVPSPCTRATGQQAYPAQCTARHTRGAIRVRNRLVTRTASSKSKATAPKPSQILRYPEVNGTTTETALIEANGSVMVVSTCSPVNVIVSRERLRCRETVTKRGQAGLANRTEVTIPSTTVPVSSTSAMSPVARVANQSGLVAVATAALGITAAG